MLLFLFALEIDLKCDVEDKRDRHDEIVANETPDEHDAVCHVGGRGEDRDPDGAMDDVTLLVMPTFVGAPNTANVTLNGGTFNGDVYVYDDGVTETVFVNNGATINGDILDNA